MDSVTLLVMGFYRAEFEAAKRCAKFAAACDWGAATVAITALFVTFGIGLYSLAIAGLSFGAGAVYFRAQVSAKKNAAEKGRRAVVVAFGLGKPLQGKELSDLRTRFSVSEAQAKAWEDADYYDSKEPPGPRRLLEMVQESAFWTTCLYRQSARRSWLFSALFALVSIGFLLVIVTIPSTEWRIKLAQASFLIVALLLARDHVGRSLAFMSASAEADAIDHRAEGLLAQASPDNDEALITVGDYNCIVESTPLVESGLYRRQRDQLSLVWKQRKLVPEQSTRPPNSLGGETQKP